MSRTTLCTLTAGALTALSLATMVLRYQALGDEAHRPIGPGTWKVTLAVHGTSLGNARLQTATPLELERQHVQDDTYHSEQFSYKPPEARHPERVHTWTIQTRIVRFVRRHVDAIKEIIYVVHTCDLLT